MSWSQQTSRQDVQSFLLDLLEIDPNELLREALKAKLAERGLTYEVVADPQRDVGYESFIPDRVVLSDGRVFVEACTKDYMGDDWGQDHHDFVQAGEPYMKTTVRFDGYGDNPVETTEEIPGNTTMPSNLDELRVEGNAASPGMGDEIADFFRSQGINRVSFEPGEPDPE